MLNPGRVSSCMNRDNFCRLTLSKLRSDAIVTHALSRSLADANIDFLASFWSTCCCRGKKSLIFPEKRSREIPRATCKTSQGMWSQRGGRGEIVMQVLPDARDRWRWPVHSNRSVQNPIRVSRSFTCFRPGRGSYSKGLFCLLSLILRVECSADYYPTATGEIRAIRFLWNQK